MAHRLLGAIFVLAGLAATASVASAQAAPQPPADAQTLRAAIDELKKEFEARLSALEMRLAVVEGGGPQAPAPVAGPVSSVSNAGPLGSRTAAAGASKVFNPDMAVIGDFLGAAGKVNTDPANRVSP